MKRFKGFFACLLLVSFMFVSLAACRNQSNQSRDGGGTISLAWYINFSWFGRPDKNNAVHQKILADTGVDIDFIIPAGNESERLNSMIASNTLPDLITLGWWEPQIRELIDAGMIWALDDLANQYAPQFWTVADEGRLGWYRSDDGKVYQYPNASYSPADYEKYDNISANNAFMVRKDIYEAIGSPDMTTPEGFVKAIRDAVAYAPSINGRTLIPFGCFEFTDNGNASFDTLMDFLAIPREDANGNIVDRRLNPEYVRWLKAFRELGAGGYLHDDIFIDQRAQMSEKMAQGRYFAILYQHTDIRQEQQLLFSENPETVFLAIDGPKNSRGSPHTLGAVGISGWTVTMIPKTSRNPARAIQLMAYLMGVEAQKLISFGPEGVGYDMIDGRPVERPEIRNLRLNNASEYGRTIGGSDGYWMLMDTALMNQWAEPEEPPMKQLIEWGYPYSVSTSEYSFFLAFDSEESNIALRVNNRWGSILPRLLLARTDAEFDDIYRQFVDFSRAQNYDKVLAEQTRQLKLNKEKLGIR